MKDSFAKRLIRVRESLSLSQREMAKLMKVSERVYLDYEKGRKKPTYEKLLPLAEIHHINLHWLLTGEGSMFVTSPHKEPSKETPTNQAGIDRELAQMLSMLSPEQQEGLKMLFRGYLKKPSSKPSASSSEKQKETVNLSNSHDENMVR
jgi:transcriptional regulator with XRE-family HTH domain